MTQDLTPVGVNSALRNQIQISQLVPKIATIVRELAAKEAIRI